MKRLRVATTNQGKLAEFRQVLEPLGFMVFGLEDMPDLHVEEDGDTFAANACKKAETVAARTSEPALADDSGLEVDALGGAPGIRSARYAGVQSGSADEANRRKLLSSLQGIPPSQRTSRFVCALAYAVPGKATRLFFGTLEGAIGTEEVGSNGFGYDPVFVLPERSCTVAQLTPQDKNAISHRGRALAAFVRFLQATSG